MEKGMFWLKKIHLRLETVLGRLDAFPLWWSGLLLAGAVFLPYVLMGEESVFPIHDQLDETLMTYVLNARHLAEPVEQFPELLGGQRLPALRRTVHSAVCPYARFCCFCSTVPDRIFGRFFWYVPLREGTYKEQHSGGGNCRGILHAAFAADLWIVRRRGAPSAVVFSVPI